MQPYSWTPPRFDDISYFQSTEKATSSPLRRISLNFHQPIFNEQLFIEEPLKLKDLNVKKDRTVENRLELMEDFDQRISRMKVSLEYCLHGHNNILTGFIRVANITYNKNVFVRFSYDDWASTQEVTAAFVKSYKGNLADQFSFEIEIKKDFTVMEFVVCYETDGCGTYWDNNETRCYKVVMQEGRDA